MRAVVGRYEAIYNKLNDLIYSEKTYVTKGEGTPPTTVPSNCGWQGRKKNFAAWKFFIRNENEPSLLPLLPCKTSCVKTSSSNLKKESDY